MISITEGTQNIHKYNTVCIWEGTGLGETTVEEFERWFLDNGFRIRFIEEVITKGSKIKNEDGGRHDILFYIHDDDIPRLCTWRFLYGIKWFDDVINNGNSYRYDKKILEKYYNK